MATQTWEHMLLLQRSKEKPACYERLGKLSVEDSKNFFSGAEVKELVIV
jgi:hypothetical protein